VTKEFDLNRFDTAQIEYLQLYSLVVRALRLCDQRSVQLHPAVKNCQMFKLPQFVGVISR
jgi:hypothetical protein